MVEIELIIKPIWQVFDPPGGFCPPPLVVAGSAPKAPRNFRDILMDFVDFSLIFRSLRPGRGREVPRRRRPGQKRPNPGSEG